MHEQRTSPLFAPEWPNGEPSPMRWARRMAYVDAHAPMCCHAVHPATIVANRVTAFDREMRRRECEPMPGWASVPGEPATCAWCGHTSTRGDMTWFDSEDDGRGWECENESACRVRFDAADES